MKDDISCEVLPEPLSISALDVKFFTGNDVGYMATTESVKRPHFGGHLETKFNTLHSYGERHTHAGKKTWLGVCEIWKVCVIHRSCLGLVRHFAI